MKMDNNKTEAWVISDSYFAIGQRKAPAVISDSYFAIGQRKAPAVPEEKFSYLKIMQAKII